MNFFLTVTYLVMPLLCVVMFPSWLLLVLLVLFALIPSVLDKSNFRSYFIVLESFKVVVHSDWLLSSGIDVDCYTLIVFDVCSIAVVLSLKAEVLC